MKIYFLNNLITQEKHLYFSNKIQAKLGVFIELFKELSFF